ncbi:EamA family transporter RarD [Pelagibacterium xiamenense]|uniref:EamA family transporter RarD n=1 Tax=Pelagibacterium xiamenense TaxID=2901140 RepID=UPI001E57526A|nr:EamA family transporter RarD [Pelagibacterium xiamenense]MCD7060154.1 EamA family transporter RarD [Pelagibacterium xiamenense]
MTSIEGAPAARGATPVRPAMPEPNIRAGVLAALGAYGMWGGFPLFFKLLEGVDSASIVAHRTVFALIFVGIVLYFRRRFSEVFAALRDRRTVLVMAVSTVLLAINWLVFVWAVETAQVLQISFGYFINPLVSIAIGMVFLGERQNRLQTAAIVIAIVAVIVQSFGLGTIPYVALTLACSFGLYGYCRKTVSVGSAPGLFVETLLMTPVALGYIAWVLVSWGPVSYADPLDVTALVVSGPLTAMALIFFAYAARQLRLTTIGMFQYLAPSLHFLSAVFILGEPLNPTSLLSFVLIWCSLGVFTWDSWQQRRKRAAARPVG